MSRTLCILRANSGQTPNLYLITLSAYTVGDCEVSTHECLQYKMREYCKSIANGAKCAVNVQYIVSDTLRMPHNALVSLHDKVITQCS